jgi:HK97 family phage major capsid protein
MSRNLISRNFVNSQLKGSGIMEHGHSTNAPASFGRMEGLRELRPGLIFNDAPTIESLQETQAALQARSEEILAHADGENREPSADELTEIETNTGRIQALDRQIAARKAIADNMRGTGARTRPNAPQQPQDGNSRALVPASPRPEGEAARFGFRNFGEYARTVRLAGGPSPDQGSMQRLQNALTTYGNEGVGADGGFMVPPDFRREIAEKVLGEQSLLSRTDQQTTTSNSIVFPIDETTPWQTSGGLQAYWEVEAGQKTQSKPSLGQNTIRLNKLIALVPVTDELLEDAPALDGYLRRKVPDKMMAKLNTSIIAGTGVGQPLGILESGSVVTVAKETSQAGDTIIFPNIVKMMSRLYAPSFANAVWLVNQNVLPQLMFLDFRTGATAPSTPVPVWMPANSVSGSPYSTLMGRPVIPVQAMPTVGDLGDIVLADLSQYLTVTKGQQIRTDVSIHLFFDYDVTAFRFVMRVGGQPWWNSTISPQNGSDTLGFFVALAERT